VAGAAVVAVALPAAPARAHAGGDADVVLTLDELPQALEGTTVDVVDRLAPQLVLANPTDRVVEVVGLDGRPFLRIGPDGVDANLAVADWYTTNDPFGTAALPGAVGGADRWARVAAEPSWGWFDHRLHPGPLRAPPEVVAVGEPAQIGTWSVPLRVDGVPATIGGAVRYQPLRGTFVPAVAGDADLPVRLSVLPGVVPGLFLDNDRGTEVVVLGADGEPFLRFTAEGPVHANTRSPSWLASARAAAGTTPTSPVDADGAPEWVEVAAEPRFGWIDPRLAHPDREPPPDVIAAAEPTEVGTWTVPVLVGGERTDVAGTITWQPAPGLEPAGSAAGGGAVRWTAVGAVALLAALGGAFSRSGAVRGRRP
jgi:hypothetical protein